MFDLKTIELSAEAIASAENQGSNGGRKPLLWLERGAEDDAYEYGVYLVNNTGETLDYVDFGTITAVKVDDDAYVSGNSGRRYENVPQGTGVKVEQIHIVYDSDYLITIDLRVKSALLGEREFRHFVSRANMHYKALLREE
ncbi:hypothetical protein J3L11_04120 [Shewanella sp. 4t3-1-2LB]|uniref:hypothetical protein n=1 Tax=Shewanella sp. 4t3-1-2LB TaxID=2817682 RepID=UPI001A991D79|nr:hypothetical protein [Shewanella sp. 4t3-1-2LB]MBO1270835.1 hypothetical protein [Shewanella sp. 4t3-1-2LB]